ncbi:MAG: GGDEF domain-containing protein [Lachnospiraceae bacterium]|nr:GGDEF domain-containing protein [Lachnospiraceae bacterium]
MGKSSFNHYGYDEETHQECMSLIRSTNTKHAHILNVWFIGINIFFMICSCLNIFGLNRLRIGNYVVFLGVAVVMEAVILAFRRQMDGRFSFLLVYLSILVLMAYSIVISVGQPYLAATMYLVLVVLVAVAYIDTMAKVALMLMAYSAIFIYTSFVNKPASVAYQDLYNIIIFMTLALVLHYTFQRARMQQYVTYQNNIRIQRELEVKSSFDALTSLLNRGRFFSMAGEVLRSPHEDEYMAICLLDLDGFKQINDRLGHQMGDKAIQLAGNTITETLGIDLSEKWNFTERAIADKLSFAGRLGGDEFITLLRGKSGKEEVTGLLGEMLRRLNGVDFEELHGIHASIGVVEIAAADHDIDDAYSKADAALYGSKRSGKNRISFNEEGEGNGD